MTKHASIRECNKHYPLIIQTEKDGWVSVEKLVKPAVPPEKYNFKLSKNKHESMSGKGLYTDQEIDAWENLMSYGDFHQAVMKDLTFGVCKEAQGPCNTQGNSEVDSYNLRNFIDKNIQKYDVVSQAKKWIEDKTGWLCLTVITIWGGQVIIAITMIGTTAVRNGLKAALAMLYVLGCLIPFSVRKIQNKINRRKYKQKEEAQLEEIPMEILNYK